MGTIISTIKLSHRNTIHIGKLGYASNQKTVPIVTLCGHPKVESRNFFTDQVPTNHEQKWENTDGKMPTCKKCAISYKITMKNWLNYHSNYSFNEYLDFVLERKRITPKTVRVNSGYTRNPVVNPIIGVDRLIGPNKCHPACIDMRGHKAVHFMGSTMDGKITPFCGAGNSEPDWVWTKAYYDEYSHITCPKCVESIKKFNLNEEAPARDKTFKQRREMVCAEISHLSKYLETNGTLIKEVCQLSNIENAVAKEFYNNIAELSDAITRVKCLAAGMTFAGLEKELNTIYQFWG